MNDDLGRRGSQAAPAQPDALAQQPNVDERSAAATDLSYALRATVPVAMGYLPLGLAYGVLLTNNGIPWYYAPLSCLLVFAGSMQFLSVSLLSGGAPLSQVALSTLAVNFRHVFYGLSFPLNLVRGRWRRAYSVLALTDETYSLVAAKDKASLTGRRIVLIQLISHGYWTASCTLGAVAAFGLPRNLEGLDFALTALFVVLALDALYQRRNVRSAIMGLAASVFAVAATAEHFLVVALGIFVAMVIAAYRVQRWRGR